MDELDGLLHAPVEAAPGLDTQLMRGALAARLFDRETTPVGIGRFEILGRVGEGGMGTVYVAHDPRLARQVALKLMRRDGPAGDRTELLLREARSLAQLAHPNVVTVFDSGVVDDEVFVAMEFLDGGSLASWCREHPTRTRADVQRTLELFVAAGRGLAAAHAAGLVHRDFKPANVLLGKDGRIKVGDFGLARSASADEGRTMPSCVDADVEARETAAPSHGSGGTPAYMAPEQFSGRADARSDQFAYCVALWEALWGERPYGGISLALEVEGSKPVVARRGVPVPRRVHAALVRGLAVKPGDRWLDMAALLDQIDPARRIARTRRRWALGLGAVAIVAALRPWEREQPPCARPDDALVGAWDESARERTRAAFARVEAPIAAETWTRLEPELDAYVLQWWSVRDEACAASLERRERSTEAYDLAMSCLERRRQALGAVVLALGDLDAQTAAHALAAVRGLPAIAPCSDADASRELLVLPTDAGLRAEIEDVQRGLARVRAELDLGNVRTAQEELAPLLERSDALARPPLQAEARMLQGEAQRAELDYEGARVAYEQALQHAARAGDDALAARIWPQLIACVGHHLVRPDRALDWELAAVTAQLRGGEDPIVRAMLHDAIGVTLMRVPDPRRAEQEHAAALALRRAHLAPDDPRIAASLGGVAVAAQLQGRSEEAVALQREALALIERGLGEHHPTVAAGRYNLASTLIQLGRVDEAVLELRASLRIYEQTFGSDHVQVAMTLAALGPPLAKKGASDEALAVGERAAAICDRHPEQRGADCAFVYSNLGTLHDWAGHTREAIAAQERAIALLERSGDADVTVLGVALTNVSALRGALGENDAAVAGLERAIALYERALGPDAAPLWHPLLRLARLHREAGRSAAALPLVERASNILRAHPVAPLRMSDVEYEHLLTRWDLGLRDAATRAVAERARELAASAGAAADVELIDQWLAEHPLPGPPPR